MTGENSKENVLRETPAIYQVGAREDDFSTLEDSLAMTPWERILANDDIINFGDSLHAATQAHNAKSR